MGKTSSSNKVILNVNVFLITESKTLLNLTKQITNRNIFQFSGEEEEKIKIRVGTFCSNQPSALELIKTRQKKDQRFNLFLQVSTTEYQHGNCFLAIQ